MEYHLENITTLEDLLAVEANKRLELLFHSVEEVIDEHEVIGLTNEKRVSKELTNKRRLIITWPTLKLWSKAM